MIRSSTYVGVGVGVLDFDVLATLSPVRFPFYVGWLHLYKGVYFFESSHRLPGE